MTSGIGAKEDETCLRSPNIIPNNKNGQNTHFRYDHGNMYTLVIFVWENPQLKRHGIAIKNGLFHSFRLSYIQIRLIIISFESSLRFPLINNKTNKNSSAEIRNEALRLPGMIKTWTGSKIQDSQAPKIIPARLIHGDSFLTLSNLEIRLIFSAQN